MRHVSLIVVAGLVVAIAVTRFAGPAPAQSRQAKQEDLHAFRLTFGDRLTQPVDRSGSVQLSSGRVISLKGWRFIQGDRIEAATAWRLHLKRAPVENQPDRPQPLSSAQRPDNLMPAGVEVIVEAPVTAVISLGGAAWRVEFRMQDLIKRRLLYFEDIDAAVHWTPATTEISPQSGEQHDYPSIAVTRAGETWIAWQAYQDSGDHVYATTRTAPPVRLTTTKADVYRTAIAEYGEGKIWVVWSQRDGGQWHLRGRMWDGSNWSPAAQISNGYSPNTQQAIVRDSEGNLRLVWVGYRDGKSYLLTSEFKGSVWSAPAEISGESAWAPEAAADSKGNVWVAWDSYRNGNYDIYLRRLNASGNGPEQPVAHSPLFQAHASVTVDMQDRVWLAWDESGANWGKDWSHEDPWRGTVLYADRKIRVGVFEGGRLRQPVDVQSAVPLRYNRYVHSPKIRSAADGRIWLALQIRTLAGNSRLDYWAAGGRWEHFLTALEGNRWTPVLPLLQSSSRPESPLTFTASSDRLHLAWTSDNRPAIGNNYGSMKTPPRSVLAAFWTSQGSVAGPVLADWTDPVLRPAEVHSNESADVSRIRGYRANLRGSRLQIVRGDFHRHTEISGDGSGDGSVEDYFRYMIDAAAMDTGIIGDHNAGNDDEYTWWRTEKAIDLYHIPGRYTPLFGYERSVAYPNGHRNVVFARRGVRTLPISPEEQKAVINSGKVLYPYLKKNGGIAMLHSLATGQGSDYRDNDPELEPLVELYQGYHASYEYEGAPRAESSAYQLSIHGGYRPAGFWWNALAKGLKLGVQASSDHIGTHNSYAMIYTPETSREEILESMRRRHAYAATDNIIVDFRAVDAAGAGHFMGDAFSTKAAPKLVVKIQGTATLDQVEIVKDGKFVFRTEPGASQAEFTYIDQQPEKRESYYYVRAIQRDRNLAWSSPIWVKYE
jgi:hypothetical protein